MSLLVSVQGLCKSYGSKNLFTDLSFSLSEGDVLGLTGPNGSGKSTFLKILAGLDAADSGTVAKRQGVKLCYASQSPEFSSATVEEILVREKHPSLSLEEAELKARILLDKAGLIDPLANAALLSGGWKKRLDIARVFMQEPDLVLLDEPTNHLDLEGILWLEKFLQKERCSYLIVSHDRCFLNNICTKIAEFNRCFPKGIFLSEGNWSAFVGKKEAFLTAQIKQERSLSAFVKEEIAWTKKSPKARTTKSKSRVQRAGDMVLALQELEYRNAKPLVDLDFVGSERETRNLLVAKNISKSLGGKMLFQGVDLKLSPGSRLGIVGRNGTGKTTLLKILSKEISQDKGTVKYADDLNLVYFDQHREKIDPNLSLKEALSPQGDFVQFRGMDIHVNGWAKKFLFNPDRLNLPVHCLSGGEKARILIARLMLKPADVLFLDEPTNDLDVPTLEIIENSLLEFPGAVVLISHDRCFMDRVCTQILGLGEECEQKIFADYAQWEAEITPLIKGKKIDKKITSSMENSKKKLSYLEKKELEGMEEAISFKEKQLEALQKESIKNGLDSKKLVLIYGDMESMQADLEIFYERWQVLLDKS